MVFDSITQMVGNTPILRLNKVEKKYNTKAKIFAKLEFYNPLFSVKDRAALSMLENIEVDENTILVEATSGNTGISLAAFCAAKGYNIIITMPENSSQERVKLMRHLGAEVILTQKELGMQGSIDKAFEIVKNNKNAIYIDQFNNENNPKAHILTTGVEIIEDMKGNIDAMVVGIGTAGSVNGLSEVFKKYDNKIKIIGVLPQNQPHKIAGIGPNFKQTFLKDGIVDEMLFCSDENAINFAKDIAKTEGLPVGISSGAALSCAVEVAQREDMKDKNVVVLFASFVERYLSTGVFD